MAHYGIYRGTVMNTADPLMKGRIMVTVPSVAGAPGGWAEACRDYGSNTAPPIGTAIWVMFEGGDSSRPVWMGCAA